MKSMTTLLGVLSLVGAQAATAGTVTSYDRTAFQAALASATLSGQNFDSLTSGSTITTVNGVTYQPSEGSALVTSSYLTTSGANGLGSTSVGYFQIGETLTLTFATAITAFAIDINTYATADSSYKVVLNDDTNSVVQSVYDVFPGDETGQFIGFTDTAGFTSVVLSNSAAAYSYTVDTLVYGGAAAVIAQSIPEPSEWALFALGIPVLVAVARRRKVSGA